MAQKKQRISDMTTAELQQKLDQYRFLLNFFRTGKHPNFWKELVQKIEQELTSRGAP